jgi:streptogramin lyase
VAIINGRKDSGLLASHERRGGSHQRWFLGRGLLIACALSATMATGCGGGAARKVDAGPTDHDVQADARSDTAVEDLRPADSSPDQTGDQTGASDAPVGDAATSTDGAPEDQGMPGPDGSDAGDAGGPSDASDASDVARAICGGLGKVEDPRGCSGAHICDGAGACVSRFTLFPVTRLTPSDSPYLFHITTGPDGNLWFTDLDRVGRMTPTGDSQEFVMPGSINGIAGGPDGNLWITDQTNNIVGRVTSQGMQREFPHVAGRPSGPGGIVSGPDGYLWFTDFDRIGKMTTSGSLIEFPVATPVPYATAIVVGADGNLWFTEQVGKIGRITTAGLVTEFPVPETPRFSYSSLTFGITAGGDGNLWFSEPEPNKIGRITPAGVVTGFPIPTTDSRPSDIAAGPDGNVWFVESTAGRIGRITPSGMITELDAPMPDTFVMAICAGPDGAMWFTLRSNLDPNLPNKAWLVRMQ